MTQLSDDLSLKERELFSERDALFRNANESIVLYNCEGHILSLNCARDIDPTVFIGKS